jgi:hypothetical protein
MGPIEVKQFELVSNIAFNNSARVIDMYVLCEAKDNRFIYGRISNKGILTVYEVTRINISILF